MQLITENSNPRAVERALNLGVPVSFGTRRRNLPPSLVEIGLTGGAMVPSVPPEMTGLNRGFQ